MFLTVHATAGALLGTFTNSPTLAFALGVISHAVLDIIPHGDETIFLRPTQREYIVTLIRATIVDGIVMCAVLAFVLRPDRAVPSPTVIAGIIGGILPDIIHGTNNFLPSVRWLQAFKRFHHRIHSGIIRSRGTVWGGMARQCLVLATLIAILAHR